MPLKRSTILVLSTIVVTFLGVSYITNAYQPSYFDNLNRALLSKGTAFLSKHKNTMASPISGFLDRADSYRRPTNQFQPPRSAIEVAVLRSTPVEPEGFTLAIVSSDSTTDESKRHYAVDAFGRIRVLQDPDVEGISNLLKQVVQLPKSERWGNTWELNQPRTSQPIDKIFVPKTKLSDSPAERYEEEWSETGVQGFDGQVRDLKDPVAGLKELPEVLFDLVGAALEARNGEAEKDEDVLAYMRNLLGNVD